MISPDHKEIVFNNTSTRYPMRADFLMVYCLLPIADCPLQTANCNSFIRMFAGIFEQHEGY